MHRGLKLDLPRISEVAAILFNLSYVPVAALVFRKPKRFASVLHHVDGFNRCMTF